jgi:Tol biopolymer transport system component
VVAAVGIVASGCALEAGRSAETRIAFQRFFRGQSRILTVRPDGTGIQRVSHATGRSENPEFSPDGKSITYERFFDVYIASSDRSERRLVVRNGYEPRWSPDGSKLLFIRYRVDSDVAIFSINVDGTKPRELTNGSINYAPAWSPDGSRIAFVRDRDLPQIWIMNGDGSGETRLTRAPGKSDYGPEWSPGGRKVLFTRYKSYGRRCLRSDIFVIKTDGSRATNLTGSCRLREWGGQWSPDGSKIAFTRATDHGAQIFVMNANGTGVRRLTKGPGRNDLPKWSPDGSRIAFISKRDGNRELYVMTADGTSETRLTQSRGMEYQQTWQGLPWRHSVDPARSPR